MQNNEILCTSEQVDMVFIILNYNTYFETTCCIESIRKHVGIPDKRYAIVIVDNKSQDDSVARIKAAFDSPKNCLVTQATDDVACQPEENVEGCYRLNDLPRIDLICSARNLGFANGNNLGINYSNKVYQAPFTVVLNSDTEMLQDDFYLSVAKEHASSGFALMGPMVVNADGRCDCSPWLPTTLDKAMNCLKYLRRRQTRLKFGVERLWDCVRKIVFRLRGMKRYDVYHEKGDYRVRQLGVELCGCFLVFSKEAFDYIEGFDNRTFLYWEEALLYRHLSKAGLTTVYAPQICIYHGEGAATFDNNKCTKNKLLWQNQQMIDSLEILIGELVSVQHDGT